MSGRKREMAPSWYELISTTSHSGAGARSASSEAGGPRPPPTLPPRPTDTPAASSMRAASAEVVVLPLVPVTAISELRKKRNANSGSDIQRLPAASRKESTGAPGGMPGLATTIRDAAMRT